VPYAALVFPLAKPRSGLYNGYAAASAADRKKGDVGVGPIAAFVKREPVLLLSVLAALISCFFVPPDGTYLTYADFRTLALLYCLMVVVAGLRTAGVFAWLSHVLCERAKSARSLGLLLTGMTFFSSMLITNDVALLTFVPFAVVLAGMTGRKRDLILVVVLQTAAANLGSMLTPVGNPQNLYLYSFYALPPGDFFRITLPVWAASFGLILLLGLCLPREALTPWLGEQPGVERKPAALYAGLFAVCLLAVFRVLGWPVMLAIVLASVLLFDRRRLYAADFMLLLTFLAFFVFAGNLARIGAVDRLLRAALAGRTFAASVLTSQVISNVPAALLLSGFTEEAKALLLGVNVGGLGTPVASLASLISLKLYAQTPDARVGRYLLAFTVVNVLLLAALTILCRFL